MVPKWVPNVIPEASRNAFQIELRFFIVFEPVLHTPGLPLASLLAPFGTLWPLFWLPLGTFGVPFAAFWHSLAFFGLPWGCFGLPKHLIASGGEISARSCQDLAEILPRTCREPSKNPPRTRRMNPKQSCLSHCDFFERTSSSHKRFGKIA